MHDELFGFGGLDLPYLGVLLISIRTRKEVIFEWGSGQEQAGSELQKSVAQWLPWAPVIHSHTVLEGSAAHILSKELTAKARECRLAANPGTWDQKASRHATWCMPSEDNY